MNFKSLIFIGFSLFILSSNHLFAQIDAVARPNPSSDLQLLKTVDKPVVRAGSLVNFTLKIKNLGPSQTKGATVFDLLPNGFTFVSSSNPLAYNNVTGEWEVNDLSVGQEQSLVIAALVNPIGPTSVYTNVAQIIINNYHFLPNIN